MPTSTSYSITGQGTTLSLTPKVSSGTPTAIAVLKLVSMDGPNVTRGEVEATVLSSTFKPYKPTLPEGEGSWTVQYNSLDPACTALAAAATASPAPFYTAVITYQDGGTETFDCFPKGFSITGVENESIVNATVPFRMVSAPVFAGGTASTSSY